MRSDKSVRSIRSIQTAKVGYLVISAALCILGVLLIVYPTISAKVLCYILGGVLTVYGIIKMVGYFSKDLYRLAFQYDLASGALITALGVIMLVIPDGVISVTHTVIGILILADGLFKVQIAADARPFGIRQWALLMAAAIITAACGCLLIFRPGASVNLLGRLLGVSLILEGAMNIITMLTTVSTAARRTA